MLRTKGKRAHDLFGELEVVQSGWRRVQGEGWQEMSQSLLKSSLC